MQPTREVRTRCSTRRHATAHAGAKPAALQLPRQSSLAHRHRNGHEPSRLAATGRDTTRSPSARMGYQAVAAPPLRHCRGTQHPGPSEPAPDLWQSAGNRHYHLASGRHRRTEKQPPTTGPEPGLKPTCQPLQPQVRPTRDVDRCATSDNWLRHQAQTVNSTGTNIGPEPGQQPDHHEKSGLVRLPFIFVEQSFESFDGVR